MGKVIIVVGNSGVGKTTLARLLCEQGGFVPGLEQIGERPFQQVFAHDLKRYALSNQVDFLLFRAEQEMVIRLGASTGILDGGLEEDFYIFTRHFYRKGYLSDAEFNLCSRMTFILRQLLPHPDLILALEAPLSVVAQRYAQRGRSLEIAQRADLDELQALLDDFISQQPPSKIIRIDASEDDPTYTAILPGLIKKIHQSLYD